MTRAERIADALKTNAEHYAAGRIPRDRFDSNARALWAEAEDTKTAARVRALVAPPVAFERADGLRVVVPPCDTCGAGGGEACAPDCADANAARGRRLCPGCDAWTTTKTECPKCGADTMKGE